MERSPHNTKKLYLFLNSNVLRVLFPNICKLYQYTKFLVSCPLVQESLASIPPDLLILDIEVNNQNSLDFLPAIHSQYPQLPVIIASSHTNGAEIIRSYDAGANHYIKKPYDITELVFQIRRLLQQPPKQTPAIWAISTYQVDTDKHLLIYPDKK